MWVNDGFMAVFFILVGLEVKRELLVEYHFQLSTKAIFPAMGAFGGMVVPALVYWFINHDFPDFRQGWAIPMATDIGTCTWVLALLGKQVPFALQIFLIGTCDHRRLRCDCGHCLVLLRW